MLNPWKCVLGFGILLAGCPVGVADDLRIDEEDDDFIPPDITGHYLPELEGLEGCEELQPPLDWLVEPLEISGPPEALLWTWGEHALDGSIDAGFSWTVGDFIEIDGWGLDVQAAGLAYIRRDLWVLEGDLAVQAVVPDGPDCTLTGVVVAREREE